MSLTKAFEDVFRDLRGEYQGEYLTGPALYRAMAEMLEGGREVQTSHGAYFEQNKETGWRRADGVYPAYNYRFKPAPKRMVKIGYETAPGKSVWKELVAPETVAPDMEGSYYVADATGMVTCWIWKNDAKDAQLLKLGQVFLTPEDAQAMSDWLAECRRGGVV